MTQTNSQKILEAFLTDIFTSTQARNRLRVLKHHLEEQFFNSGQSNQDINNEDVIWLRSLDPEFYKNFTKDNLYQIFTDLENALQNITALVVYLAFEPGGEETEEIGRYIRTNFKTVPIIDLKLDPALIGGCALVYNGVYRDYSVKGRIEASKTQIMADLKSFLRK